MSNESLMNEILKTCTGETIQLLDESQFNKLGSGKKNKMNSKMNKGKVSVQFNMNVTIAAKLITELKLQYEELHHKYYSDRKIFIILPK